MLGRYLIFTGDSINSFFFFFFVHVSLSTTVSKRFFWHHNSWSIEYISLDYAAFIQVVQLVVSKRWNAWHKGNQQTRYHNTAAIQQLFNNATVMTKRNKWKQKTREPLLQQTKEEEDHEYNPYLKIKSITWKWGKRGRQSHQDITPYLLCIHFLR